MGIKIAGRAPCDPSTADIPVILMSAAHSRASAISSADAVIAKPFDLDTLDSLIERLVTHRSEHTA